MKADLLNLTAKLPRKKDLKKKEYVLKSIGYLFTFIILHFCINWVKYRSDPSTPKATPFPLRMTINRDRPLEIQ